MSNTKLPDSPQVRDLLKKFHLDYEEVSENPPSWLVTVIRVQVRETRNYTRVESLTEKRKELLRAAQERNPQLKRATLGVKANPQELQEAWNLSHYGRKFYVKGEIMTTIHCLACGNYYYDDLAFIGRLLCPWCGSGWYVAKNTEPEEEPVYNISIQELEEAGPDKIDPETKKLAIAYLKKMAAGRGK